MAIDGVFAPPKPGPTAMPDRALHRLDIDVFSRRDIAAEPISEHARRPSYDELWRNQHRQSVEIDSPLPRRASASSVVTLLAAGIAVTALIGMREKVVRVMPSAAAVFSMIGLPVNLAGLELRSLRSQLFVDGSRKVLTIEGEIVNLRREANRVPSVALTVRGGNGQDKYSWTTPAPKARLEAGETIAFRARLASPPPDGADVLARFASAESESRIGSARP
jgi:hypothetical protein